MKEEEKEEKLIKILRTLSPKEMSNFGRFLEGTAKRKSPNQIALFDYLEGYHPKFPALKMKREYIAQRLFPNASNPDRTVRDSMSKFGTVLNDFIVWKELKKEQQEQYDFLLLKAYKRRKLDDIFFDEIKKNEKAWSKRKTEGIEQLYNKYLLKKVHFTHPSYRQEGQNRITYKDLIELLDEYYFAEKLLWTSCLKVTQEFVNTSSVDFAEKQHLIQEILRICLNDTSSRNNQIKFLAEMLNVLIIENFQSYPQLEQQFISNLESFNEVERNDLMELLCHISLRDSTINAQERLQRAFGLNKRGISEKWILENENITVYRFSNIVHVACAFGELDWARYFIDDFRGFLGINRQKDVVKISHAYVDFKEGKYEKVLEDVDDKNFKFKDVLYKAHSKVISIQCCYELDYNCHEMKYSDKFHNNIAKFRRFITEQSRKELAEDSAQGFRKFIDFVSRLGKVRYEYNREIRTILRGEIENCNQVFYKQWLLEKVEELRRR